MDRIRINVLLGAVLSVLALTGCLQHGITVTPGDESKEQDQIEQQQDDTKDASVRENMQSVQTALELYAQDHGETYPAAVNGAFKKYFHRKNSVASTDSRASGARNGNRSASRSGENGNINGKKSTTANAGGKYEEPTSLAPVNPFTHKAEWPIIGTITDVDEGRSAYPKDMKPGTIEYNAVDNGKSYAIIGGGSNGKALAGHDGTLVLSLSKFSRLPKHTSMHLEIRSDDDFKSLSAISTLVGLDIKCTRATDDGLDAIVDMTNIEHLDLSCTGITDNGLEKLSELSALVSLNLSDTDVSSDGLAYLSNIRHLKRLELERTLVGNEALKALCEFPDLRELDLKDTNINDSDLTELRNMKHLEDVTLSGRKITDAGLAHLDGLSIKMVNLENCAITENGLKQFQKINPNCHVVCKR